MDLAWLEKLRNKREILGIDYSIIKIKNTGLTPAITPKLIYICTACKSGVEMGLNISTKTRSETHKRKILFTLEKK